MHARQARNGCWSLELLQWGVAKAGCPWGYWQEHDMSLRRATLAMKSAGHIATAARAVVAALSGSCSSSTLR